MKQNPDSSPLCEEGPSEIPILPTALWVGSYLVALLVQKYLVLSAPMQVAVALIPVAPFVFFVVRFVAHLRRLDELHRRVPFRGPGWLLLLSPLFLPMLRPVGR